eukprot:4012604-Prymnesium_polylepis.2
MMICGCYLVVVWGLSDYHASNCPSIAVMSASHRRRLDTLPNMVAGLTASLIWQEARRHPRRSRKLQAAGRGRVDPL